MHNGPIDKELMEFFNFAYKNKKIFLLVLSIFIISGLVKGFTDTYHWVAESTLLPPTSQAISLLNFERTSNTKIKPIHISEAFAMYSNFAAANSVQQKFLDAHAKEDVALNVIQGPGSRLVVKILANDPVLARALMKGYLYEIKKLTLDKVNHLSRKIAKVASAKTKKDIKHLHSLQAQYEAKSQLTTKDGMDVDNTTSLLSESLKNQKIVSQYQAMTNKYIKELPAMYYIPVKLGEVEFFQFAYEPVVKKQSVWSYQIKSILRFSLLGFMISTIVMLLVFLYRSDKNKS